MLSTVFSLSVSAAESHKNVDVNGSITDGTKTKYFQSVTVVPQNGNQESSVHEITTTDSNYRIITTSYNIHNSDNSPLFYSGKKTTVKLSNVYYTYRLEGYVGSNQQYYIYSPDTAYVKVNYVDGTSEYITSGVTFNDNNNYYINLEIVFTPEKDVKNVIFITEVNVYNLTPFDSVVGYLGECDGDGKYVYNIEQSSEEAGLLSGIIGKLQSLWDTVVDGFNSVSSGITNIVNKIGDGINDIVDSISTNINNLWGTLKSVLTAITNLPSRIWTAISNGLQTLFIPESTELVVYVEAYEDLFRERFGALYQAHEIVEDFVSSVQHFEENDLMNIPKVSIDVGDGQTFSFGGYIIKIVPEGFEFLVLILKGIMGVVCTFAFVNGLRKKFDDIMEG